MGYYLLRNMKKIFYLWPFLIFFIIFNNWFISPLLTASDWPHFFTETIKDFPLFPPAWAPIYNNGLGGEVILYALDSYVYFINWIFVSVLGLPWEIVYKVFIFFFFVLLSILSSIYLLKTVLRNLSILQMLTCSLLFTSNTYIFMVVGGGQVGVALAYCIAPLILARFIILIDNVFESSKKTFQSAIVAGVVLAMQVMFDARIAYITLIAVGLYLVFSIPYFVLKNNIYSLFSTLMYVVIIPLGVIVLLHASWIMPLVVFWSSPAQELINQQTSIGAFSFFSFASFSQTLSLLHPNWPENIFGKVYFMKSEFLLLPILAFSSLIFLNGKLKKIIIFFVFLGLIGAFFAKGANEPFGLVNELFYKYIPGMTMFRDSTKFYLLTALSYSILIPFSLLSITMWIKEKIKNVYIQTYFHQVFFICLIGYLIFIIYPVLLNQLGGTFIYYQTPQEYNDLKNLIYNQPKFSRTLWVPRQQRDNFYSYSHPAISATGLFKATNSAEIFKWLRKADTKEYLANISVQYIIVPYDVFGEIFVNDRKYDEKQYQDVIEQLDTITWLEKINGFGKIAVYKTISARDHFWIDGQGSISYRIVGPTEYRIKVGMEKSTTVVFTESYSPHWVAEIDNKTVKSQKTKEGLNSFLLEKTGEYRIYFVKQKIYDYGRIFSALSFLLILILLWRLRKK